MRVGTNLGSESIEIRGLRILDEGMSRLVLKITVIGLPYLIKTYLLHGLDEIFKIFLVMEVLTNSNSITLLGISAENEESPILRLGFFRHLFSI